MACPENRSDAPSGKLKRSLGVRLALLALLYLSTSAVRLCVGHRFGWPGGNPFVALWQLLTTAFAPGELPSASVVDIRVFRVVSATTVGVGLASSGVALQVLLRNPLAEPFILGLSSGAAVGVMALKLASQWVGQALAPAHLGAMLGAAVTMAIVFVASRRRGVLSPLGLLLVGVVLGTINGAVILTLNYFSGASGMQADISRWMMGYLNEAVSPAVLLVSVAVVATGSLLLLVLGPVMDAATFPDAEAHSVGVRLAGLRVVLFLLASILAAAAVVLAGPIAFVGLISPHMARIVLGPRHRPVVAGAAAIGATLLLSADVASNLLDIGQGLMPLGIFTAILGGPIFIGLLRSRMTGPLDS